MMSSLHDKVRRFISAPKARLIWLALALCLLGSASCPVTPSREERAQISQERETMNTQSDSQTASEKMQREVLASPSAEVQTATFALG